MSRKWEDLELDCLVNILGRVGTESLVLHVPFVCKSWYKASLNPTCWQHVHFRGLCKTRWLGLGPYLQENLVYDYAFGEFMISIVSRGLGKTTSLVLPSCDNVLLKLAEEKKCPELKSMSINMSGCSDCLALFGAVGKWKLLEELRLKGPEGWLCYTDFSDLSDLVAVIRQNCNNFNCLAVYNAKIRDEVALAIAVHIQKIKKITMVDCFIEQENLERIISACKDLQLLEVNRCFYEKILDEEKLRSLGSHIKTLIQKTREFPCKIWSNFVFWKQSEEYQEQDVQNFQEISTTKRTQ